MPVPVQLVKLLPCLAWPRPTLALLRNEAAAGITVGMMVIPQGVAYARLAGMPLITGIYASLLPALVAVLFSASARLSVGPTALTSLLTGAALVPFAAQGSADWISLAVWLALLSGLLQIVLGAIRFGWMLNLVNAPVLMAFTQAAAILIMASQLPALLGLPDSWSAIMAAPSPHWSALAYGVTALVLLRLARRWRPAFPAVIVILVAAAGASWLLGFEGRGGDVVGHLPQGLPALYWPSWPGLQTLGQLTLPVLAITLISFLETAASAKVDNQGKGERWDQDQDLIGQGLAKLASGLSGAFATSSSFSRSALNLYAGAQTGWATIFSVVMVLLALLLLTPLLHHVPQAVLAAIVIAAVMNLVRPREFIRVWAISRVEAVIALLTFGITIITAPALYWGVLAGVLMALSYFLFQRLHPRIVEVGRHGDGTLRDRHRWHLDALLPHALVMRMDAELDFASAAEFERYIVDYLNAHPDTHSVCLLAHPINRVDATGAEVFARIRSQLMVRGVALFICGLKMPAERALSASGGLAEHPLLHIYRGEQAALRALQKREQERVAAREAAAGTQPTRGT